MSNDHQVFVDDTGKRKIAFNAITWTAGLAIAAFTVLLLISLTSNPTTNDGQEIDYRATVPSSTTTKAVLPHLEREDSTTSRPSSTRETTNQTITAATTATTRISKTPATNNNVTPSTTTSRPASDVTNATPEIVTGPQDTAKGRNSKVPPGLDKKPK